MKYLKGMSIVLVALSLVVFVRTEALAKKVVGNINSVNIEHCGIAPGSCKGSVEIAQADGKKINLQIDFGSRLFKKVKESDRYRMEIKLKLM
jgi:hypothetical protein